MGRIAVVAMAVFLVRGENYAQQPAPDDAHENPVIQNSPVGKKEPPDTPEKSTPPAQEMKPTKATSPPASPSHLAAQAPVLNSDEAIPGTWKLVPEKSKFNPGPPPPKSEIPFYLATPDGIQAIVKTAAADGTLRSKVDNLTSEATMKHRDMVIATERRQFAPDGKTMSIDVKDLSSADKPISSLAVYQKQ